MEPIPVHYLRSYLYCPRKLYLAHRDKEAPKTSASKTARREIARMFNREERFIVSETESILPLPELVERYKQHYSKKTRDIMTEYKDRMKEEGQNIPQFIKRIWPRVMHEAEERAENLYKVMERTGLSSEALWDALSPKLRTDLLVEGEGMRGKIDLIKEYPSESLPYIFTAKKPPRYGVWDSDKLVAGAYTLILSSAGIPCTEARVVYLGEREDAEREVVMNGFLKRRIIETRDKVAELIRLPREPGPCLKCASHKHNAPKDGN